MNKIKTTAKEVRNAFSKIIALAPCEATELLRAHSPMLYTYGIYGWNFDVYVIEDTAICVGVRGMPGIRPERDLIQWYDDCARGIWAEVSCPYKECVEQVDVLLRNFIDETLVRDSHSHRAVTG